MSEEAGTGQALQRTPLHARHGALGARMAPFGGWDMPIDYGSIIEEHKATRQAAGLFDLSHMGEFFLGGPGALDLVAALLTNDPRPLPPGQGQYAPMCRADGTIVDDVIVYHLPDTPGAPGYPLAGVPYLLVVNAANIAKDWAWVNRVRDEEHLTDQVTLEDRSAQTALIALQGPRAAAILTRLAGEAPAALGSFAIAAVTIAGAPCLAARTGYTGEDGFEIILPNEHAVAVWDALIEAGRDEGLRPVGLGARDTLRLEARLPLYGNDIDDTTTPLEAGLGRWVRLEKPAFRGREVLLKQKEAGLARKLVGLAMDDRSVPRAHYRVLDTAGTPIGAVTSGSFSPTLGKGIALAYLPTEQAAVGTAVQVEVRGQGHPATVVKTPFYRRNK